jgi:predicted nucleic acid-binding protein
MERAKVVVDASVIVKWFLEEEFSEEALRLRNDYVRRVISIAVPSLLDFSHYFHFYIYPY